jgi:hypothetical protein
MLPSSSAGAFIILGLFLAGMNYLNIRKAEKEGKTYEPPANFDCRHCNICNLGKDSDQTQQGFSLQVSCICQNLSGQQPLRYWRKIFGIPVGKFLPLSLQ